jgi:ribose 1,5-bisphosphokinase PhnN
MIETLIAKVGRETFQGIANRLERTAERRGKAALMHHLNDGRRHGTHMTICTSSFIRTMTVGSGF